MNDRPRRLLPQPQRKTGEKIMAELIRCISENGGVLVTALDSTEIVERMFCIHHTSPVCSAALGRLLTGPA